MGVPQVYRKADERAIASFNFVDIATGLGFITFFGLSSETLAAGISFHLNPNVSGIFSSNATTKRTTNGTTTIDFDTSTFNFPRTAKGTAYFSAGMAESGSTVQLKVQLKKVDAQASETNITSEISSNSTIGGTLMVFIDIPITETLIKTGEFLRLTVKLVMTTGGTAVEVGHDPANSDGTYLIPSSQSNRSTIMKLLMPFKVDL